MSDLGEEQEEDVGQEEGDDLLQLHLHYHFASQRPSKEGV